MGLKYKGREIAVRALYAIEVGKNSVADALLPFKYESPVALEYALKLVNGTLEKLQEIDEAISNLLENWKLERMNVIDKQIIRIAIYELDQVDPVEQGVVVHDSVELAKRYGDLNSGDFVNAILRSYLRVKYGESASGN